MEIKERQISSRSLWKLTFIMGGLGIILLLGNPNVRIFGNLMVLTPIIFWMYKLFIKNWAQSFQNTFLVSLENKYRKFLGFALSGFKPILFLGGTFFYFLVHSH